MSVPCIRPSRIRSQPSSSAVEGPTEGIPLVDDSDADSDFIENGGPSTPARRLQTDDLDEADQPIGSGRPRRSTSKRKDYHSHPLDGVINRKGLTPKRSRRDSSTVRANDSSPLRGHDRRSGASGAEPYSAARRRPRASRSQTSDAGRDQDRSASKGRGSGKVNGKAATAGKGTGRRRTFNGRVTMNDQTLKASDGDKRGNGTWPAKGENTVKGNVVGHRLHATPHKLTWLQQEIECDVVRTLLLYVYLRMLIWPVQRPVRRLVPPAIALSGPAIALAILMADSYQCTLGLRRLRGQYHRARRMAVPRLQTETKTW